MITFPNSKINIGLNIVEKRVDGYHNLETVFYPIPLQDALEIVPAPAQENGFRFTASVIDIEGNPEANLVVKAYKLLSNLPDRVTALPSSKSGDTSTRPPLRNWSGRWARY